jgi:uncharacterized protein (DUF58 family)
VNALRSAIVRGARRTTAGGIIPRGTRAGDGYAFDRLRGYVDGDDPRRIDWSATARLGALQTRVYREETELVLAALVDTSPSMGLGRTRALHDAADEAVRAWFGCTAAGDRARRIVGDRLIVDSRAAIDVVAPPTPDLRRSLAFGLRALPAGSSFLFVTDGLDFTADDDDDLVARVGRRFDATVLLARDPWIDDLPLRGLVRVRDVETGRTTRLAIGSRTRERYRHAAQARDAALRERFARARWRVGTLDEADGGASLERVFGLRRDERAE